MTSEHASLLIPNTPLPPRDHIKSFAHSFAHHPNVEQVVVVDKNEKRTSLFENMPNVVICPSFEAVLEDPTIDAVVLFSGIDVHAEMTLAVLRAGKHCGCAVPMATSIEDIRRIVNAARESGKKYMMMETDLFGPPFMKAKEMPDSGEFGKVQHMRGIHYRPMDDGYWNTPTTAPYWGGLPPMHYATHAVAPLYKIAGSRIESVVCMGTGTMAEHLVNNYGNPYPIEDAIMSFENGLKAEVVRGLFECSASFTESFNIYGSKKSLIGEYTFKVIEKVYSDMTYDKADFIETPLKRTNYYWLLPKELHKLTVKLTPEQEENYEQYLDTAPLVTHSSPHVCHEFVSCIIEDRKSFCDEDDAANITAAGICAHESAMKGGEKVCVPRF